MTKNLTDDLRKRFISENLGLLSRSPKFAKEKLSVKAEDDAFVSNDNTKRIEWHIGKVLEIFKPKDG